MRARKALERIYKAAPSDVLDDLVVYWDRLHALGVGCRFGPRSLPCVLTPDPSQDIDGEQKVFAMLQILAPSPQTVVSMICDKLGSKGSGVVDRNKSPFLA